MPFDISRLLVQYGYLAVFLTPLIESAGIPVPGETMLIAAAAYAGATGQLDIVVVILAAAAGTILGGTGGYLAGLAGGRRLAQRYGRYVALTPERLRLLERFFRRHGGKSIFIGRFLSVLRTWVAFTAGVSRMSSGRFLAWNAAGGLVWAFFWGTVTYRLGTALRGGTVVLLIGMGVGALLLIGLMLQGRRLEHLLLDPEEGTTREG
jgi:membrane protein DedA with SNARE-associated domain